MQEQPALRECIQNAHVSLDDLMCSICSVAVSYACFEPDIEGKLAAAERHLNSLDGTKYSDINLLLAEYKKRFNACTGAFVSYLLQNWFLFVRSYGADCKFSHDRPPDQPATSTQPPAPAPTLDVQRKPLTQNGFTLNKAGSRVTTDPKWIEKVCTDCQKKFRFDERYWTGYMQLTCQSRCDECLKDRRARARAEAAGATVSNVIAVPPCTRTVAFDADSGLSSDEDLWNFGDDEF